MHWIGFLLCTSQTHSMSLLDENDDRLQKLITDDDQQEAVGNDLVVDDSDTKHLVIHFDINETILIGDEAGGDSRQDVVNKMIAKSAFVRIDDSVDDTHTYTPTHWWDGSLIDQDYPTNARPPPLYIGWEWPEGCCPYYRTAFKNRSKTFVDGHGSIYRPLYDHLQVAIRPTGQVDDHSILSHMIPAFFEALERLATISIPHTLVFRTFGSDLPEIATAVADFAGGKHPDHANFHHPPYVLTPDKLFAGRWIDMEGTKSYALLQNGQVVAQGDAQVLELIHRHSVVGIQDDYQTWDAAECDPTAGKPVWKVPGYHHVLFDDNIHNLVHDSIAGVRVETGDGTFRSLTGEECRTEQGRHLIRVPTVAPVLDRQWFWKQLVRSVRRCTPHDTLYQQGPLSYRGYRKRQY